MVILLQKKGACGNGTSRRKMVLVKNVIFDQKKGACGKPPAGGKWFWSFFCKKKKSACGKPPAGGKLFFSLRNTIFTQKKAPAAIGQPEENGFGHFDDKKGACGTPPAGGKLFFS